MALPLDGGSPPVSGSVPPFLRRTVRRVRHLVTPPNWQVLVPPLRGSWGSQVRRQRIFERLAQRTDAEILDRYGLIGLTRPARWVRRGALRPRLAVADQVPPAWLEVLPDRVVPTAVAIYDDRVAQSEALGISMSDEDKAAARRRTRANHELFAWSIVPTASFAAFVGLDLERVIVGGNGTDVKRIVPQPWPEDPAVGFVSGAAPGRGIEFLIEVVRLVRRSYPGCRLLLWLATTSAASAAYLAELQTRIRGESWIVVRQSSYEDLGRELGEATVLTVPHPPSAYMDVALPVKLLDSLAAGRPLVVTPRTETAAVVRATSAGLVVDDHPASMADAILRLLSDSDLCHRLGARAREAAESQYDWRHVGDRLAQALLARTA